MRLVREEREREREEVQVGDLLLYRRATGLPPGGDSLQQHDTVRYQVEVKDRRSM